MTRIVDLHCHIVLFIDTGAQYVLKNTEESYAKKILFENAELFLIS